jgi:hypothetical protein
MKEAAAVRVGWAGSGRGLGWRNARKRKKRPTAPSCSLPFETFEFDYGFENNSLNLIPFQIQTSLN